MVERETDIQRFADFRQRPALALLIDGEELAAQHLFDVDRATANQPSGPLDLIIDSVAASSDSGPFSRYKLSNNALSSMGGAVLLRIG